MTSATVMKPGRMLYLTVPESVSIDMLREEAAKAHPFKLHIRSRLGPTKTLPDGKSMSCKATLIDDRFMHSIMPTSFPLPGYIVYTMYFIPTDECAANDN